MLQMPRVVVYNMCLISDRTELYTASYTANKTTNKTNKKINKFLIDFNSRCLF